MPADRRPALAAVGRSIFDDVGHGIALLATSPKARNRALAFVPGGRILRDDGDCLDVGSRDRPSDQVATTAAQTAATIFSARQTKCG